MAEREVRVIFHEHMGELNGVVDATIEVSIPEGWTLVGFRLPVDHRGRFPILELVKSG